MEFLQSCIQIAFYGGLLFIGAAQCQPIVKHCHCSVECLGRVSHKVMDSQANFCRKDVHHYLNDSGFDGGGRYCIPKFELHSILYHHCMEKHLKQVVCRRTSGIKIKSLWNWWPVINGYMTRPSKKSHRGHSHSHSHSH